MRAGFFPESLRDAALELADIRPGDPANTTLTAADLGAGTGFLTEALLAAGLTVFAVDQSPAMLEHLSTRFAPTGRVTTLLGPAERLPLPDASVDRVLSNMFLHHVDDPARAIAEMARILRPGGRVVITDLDRHAHEFLLTEHHDRWPGFDRADVSAWMAAAGFAEARVECAGQRCCASPASQSGGQPASQPGGPQENASISIFAAHGTRPLCPNHAEDLDPEAVGVRARSFFEAAAPLLCAESVLRGVAEALGVRSALVPRVASGLCSGVARTSGTCGAYNGGVLALGLALGRETGRDSLDPVYAAVLEFTEWFETVQASTNCRELTGCDFSTPEGQHRFRQEGVKAGVCLPLVAAAAAQVIRILADQ